MADAVSVAVGAPATSGAVALTGTGTVAGAPVLTLAPATLAFGNQNVATTSAAQTVTVSNTGAAALAITSITTAAPFAVATNACGATLAAGANCAVGVTFTPAALGAQTGTLNVVVGAPAANGTVTLTGTGVTPGANPTVQTTQTSSGTGPRTTPAFSTTTAGEVLVAFAGSDGPGAANAQTLTITGAGLTWTRVQRAATRSGVAEIWTATAPAILTNVTVTSTQAVVAGGPFNGSLTVIAFTNASAVGASNIGGAATGAPTVSLVAQAAGSVVYAVGNDFDNAIARTLPAGQSKVTGAEFLAPSGDTFWVQFANTPTAAAGATVTLNDTAPTADQWNFAIVEIKR